MIYLPTLHTFAMNNIFTGSHGNLRFRIAPKVAKLPGSKEVDIDFVIEKWKRRIEDSEDNIERLIQLDNELIKAFEE